MQPDAEPVKPRRFSLDSGLLSYLDGMPADSSTPADSPEPKPAITCNDSPTPTVSETEAESSIEPPPPTPEAPVTDVISPVTAVSPSPILANQPKAEETGELAESTPLEASTPPTLPPPSHPAVAIPSSDAALSEVPATEGMAVLHLPGTQILIPGLGLTTPALKPKLRLHLATLYQPNWAIGFASTHPIDRFTPKAAASTFYSKLKAVAQPAAERDEG